MNKVILIGRLTADPDIRRTQSGKCVASYRLAVDRPFKSDGQPEADFISCVAWGKSGEFCQRYLHKGMKIALEGRIQTRTYDDKDGKKVYVTEVIVEHHEFCEGKRSADSGGYAEPAQGFTEIDDDGSDLPF
nr:MAG TPA: Single strand binding protein [Caudoviricetes sp.]